MSNLRTLVFIVAALFLVSTFAAAQCTPATNPGAKICSPVNGSTVSSPVHVVVGTADTAHKVTEINVYVDNVSVFKTTTASSVDTNVTIAPGNHVLRIQVWDTTGAIYRDSVNITVTNGPPQTTVTISPTSATVAPNGTQQFNATVTNNSNTNVNWSVDGVVGGNATTGTVSVNGLYTAPAANGSHTVTATSAADATKSASAAVTVSSGPVTTISVSPTNASVLVNATQQFTATVTNNSDTSVTWAVDGVTGGNATTGTISASGLYTAPATAGSHTVKATSNGDPTKFAQASVSVVTSQPSCTPATDPGAKICAPTNGSTVNSPFNVNVVTKDTAHRISAIYTYIDNVIVNKTYAGTADFSATAVNGTHNLRVQVWDTTGAILRDSINITVGGTPQTTVTISPTSATIAPNGTQQFNATVTNNSNTNVNWSVDGVAGGDATVGTVSASGLYTAPAGTGSHTVTATSAADATKSASAAVTVSNGPATTVSISPTSANVVTNATQQFTATVTNNSNTSVTWSVDGVNGGNSAAGTISASGLYTAPASAGSHTVKATSVADTTKSASAAVTVTSSGPISVTVSPKAAVITPELTQHFAASTASTWSVDGIAGGDATVGTISASGVYTPPPTAGNHTITATSTADSSKTGTSRVYVSTYAGVFTYHNDVARTGQNTEEIALTPANVHESTFGKLFSRPVDGFVFAQPLYLRNVNIGGPHNVVYVTTENASIYAFDADGRSSSPLWHRSFLNPGAGVTAVTSSDVGNSDLGPLVSITSTPVIDAANSTMYVLVRTKENGSYFQRLHAISLTTGADKMTAATISASVNGSGVGGDGAGHISFNPLIQNQRAGLLLANGTIYVAWASHGDLGAYHGWLMAYNASTLARVAAWNLTANGSRGGIWMGGAGPAADSNGFVYLTTGNGTNDVAGSNVDFGDAYIKVKPDLTLQDFFSPYDQSSLNSGDLDIAASGVILLPDQAGAHPHLMVGSGKRGDIYVINRDSMGGFHSGSNSNIVQYLPRAVGQNSSPDELFGTGSYWNGNIYYAGSFDHLKQFSVSNGLLSTTAVHTSPQTLASDRAAEPVVSANGNADGIVWVIATDTYTQSVPLVLHAYEASNVSNELWNSAQNASRDAGGKVVKFTTPTVANGRVYVGTRSTLDVYGLLP